IHLSDPAADGNLVKDAEKKDLADLARFIYELVNLRPYSGGTIGRSRDWDDLGPNGEDWRSLCNVLLDAGGSKASADDRDLEKILARIQTWILKPKKSKLPMAIAAGFLIVTIVGGGAAYYFTRPPKLDFNQANW